LAGGSRGERQHFSMKLRTTVLRLGAALARNLLRDVRWPGFLKRRECLTRKGT